MPYTLAINTAVQKNALALLAKDRVIFSREWHANANEAKRLFTTIQTCVSKTGISFAELSGVIVVTGPGSFSAVRVGVTTANIIAAFLNIPLYPLDLPTLHKVQQTYASQRFADCALAWLHTNPKPEKIAKPAYNSPPHITISKKCNGISLTC